MQLNNQQDRREFVHRVDSEGRIGFVNDDWLAFAAENGWRISAKQVLGTQIMDNIEDPQTRHIYNLLIDRVREEGCEARFNYRCDSPHYRRFMEMRIHHIRAQDQVEFRSRVLRLEQREPVDLLDTSLDKRSDEILNMCSWCKAVLVDETWVEVERAVEQLGILADPVLPRISHGICPDCRNRMTGLVTRP